MSSVNFIAKSIEADIESVDELGGKPFATTPLTPVTGRNFAPLPIDLLRSSVKKRLKTYKHAPRTLAGQLRQTSKVFSIHQDSHTPKAAATTTPHAIRALRQRHAAATNTARNRRKSGREERESPRDALRQLSRILARSTQPVEPSLSPALPHSALRKLEKTDDDDEWEDDPQAGKPTFSIPIQNEDEDEDSWAAPPRLSFPFEAEVQSVEKARQADRAVHGGRLSRGSLGDMTDDRFGDLTNLYSDEAVDDHKAKTNDGILLDPEEEAQEDVMSPVSPRIAVQSLTSGLNINETISQSSVGAYRLSRSFDEVENSFVFDVSRFVLNGTPSQKATNGPEENLEWPKCPTPALAAEDELCLPDQISKSKPRKPKVLAVSRRGISYSPLPARVVKTVASRFQRLYAKGGKATIKGDTLIPLMEASNEFFEQLGYDLKAYAQHAKRKKIDESDVTTVMKRQRHLTATRTTFSLAQKYLPRELLQEVLIRPSTKRGQRAGHQQNSDQ
ncbi:hypothetical protein MMC31_005109 [Peltigera leucophlebia]|nr:hypothetical protein [Peltigera leucophlebia]